MSLPLLQFGVPGGVELLISLFVLFLTLIVPLVVSVLIYRDAKRRGSRHALAWAVGAFLGSLVVWILYYVVRDEVGRGRAASRGRSGNEI
jgi:uncharacterized BrkB/YihY/UPF0761 family membrane protein